MTRSIALAGALFALLVCPAAALDADTPAPALTVYNASPIALITGAPIPIVVRTGGKPLSDLAIVPFTLFEKISEQPLGGTAIKLVDFGAKKLSDPIKIGANTTKVLYITGATASGHYSGPVTITANAGKPVTIDSVAIDLSTNGEKWLGAVLLLLSVLISVLGVRLLANGYIRQSALLQAALAEQRIEALRTELTRKCSDFSSPKTDAHLTTLKDSLETSDLEANGLQKLWSAPSLTSSQDAAKLSQYLAGIALQITAEERVVRDGLEAIAAEYADADEQTQKLLKDAYHKIDALSATLTPSTNLDELQTQIAALLPAPPPPPVGILNFLQAAADDSAIPSEALKTPEQYQRELHLISGGSWLIVIAATLLSGCYVFFLSSGGNGFSLANEWSLCLLWGLGLPTGAQAVTATLSGVMTAFGVQPRPTS